MKTGLLQILPRNHGRIIEYIINNISCIKYSNKYIHGSDLLPGSIINGLEDLLGVLDPLEHPLELVIYLRKIKNINTFLETMKHLTLVWPQSGD